MKSVWLPLLVKQTFHPPKVLIIFTEITAEGYDSNWFCNVLLNSGVSRQRHEAALSGLPVLGRASEQDVGAASVMSTARTSINW